jgi:hypothetical protein
MKLVIEHSKTKREISGPFSVIGSPRDLMAMAKQIEEKFVEWDGDFIERDDMCCIVEIVEKNTHIDGPKPKGWDE